MTEFTAPPETELLHWGRDEEFDEPTFLYEIEQCGATYVVSALDSLDACTVPARSSSHDPTPDPDHPPRRVPSSVMEERSGSQWRPDD